MTKILLRYIFSISFLSMMMVSHAQECAITINRPSADTIICMGDSVYLMSEGSCDMFLNNGFEDGLGVGWSSASANPSFPNFSCLDPNPDIQEYRPGPGPLKNYMWVGATPSNYRGIITDSFDITLGNCQVRFWMRFGRAVGESWPPIGSPCEDPNDWDEGLHLAYSIDDGASWIDFPGIGFYPEGPNTHDPPFVTYTPGTGGYWPAIPTPHTQIRWDSNSIFWWHEYTCPIPAAAVTTATRFQFYQNTTSGEGWDTWGLDEVKIFCSNNQNVVWSHGPTVFNPVDPVSPTDTTLYWVMVMDTMGNFARDSITIFVAENPDTDLGNDTTICWNGSNTAIFDAGAGFETYLWNTGQTTQIITPNTTGTYIVQVWNATCYDTDTVQLTVIAATVAFAGSDESICQGGSWDFNLSTNPPATISADSVLWFGGLGTFVNPDDLRPVYNTDPLDLGPITLGMIAFGAGPCGDDTSYMVLTVDTVPTVDFTTMPVDTACFLVDITFTGSADITINTWNWDFGDGNFGSGQIVTHAYTAPGTYNITLLVISDFGCVDSITYTRIITDPLIYFSHIPSPSCENDMVSFDGLGDIVTYADWIWDFGDATPQDTGRNVSHIYPNFGTYTVTLTVCNQDTTYDHTVLETCDADAGSNEIICEYYPYEFINSTILPTVISSDSLRWIGGLGTFDDPTILLPVYTPAAGELGDISLSLISYGIPPCGNDTSTMILSVLDGPEADFTYVPDDSLCVNEIIDFIGSSTTTIINWEWDFGDGSTGIGQNVTYAYTVEGIYDVMLVVTNDTTCVDTVIYTLEIHILPDADFIITPNDSVCLNTEMTFDANSTTNIISWDWDFGDGSQASGQSVNYTYVAPGDYDVFLYVLNENSCTDTVFYPVTIFDLPGSDFTMSPNDTNCIDEVVFFDGTGTPDIVGWYWDFDDGNFASGQNVTNTFAAEGIYNVMLIVTDDNGCLDTTIYQRVIMDISVDFTITPTPSCLGDNVWFEGIGDVTFTDWEWDFGDGNTDIGHDVFHLYSTYDTFDIRLVVCSDTVIKSHIVQEPTSAFAGSDESICEYFSFNFASAASPPTANAFDSLRWFGGLGTFDDPTVLHPIYTPAPGELGPVQLSLISLARIPCGNDTSSMWLTIFDGPEADFIITPPDSICV
ncbi:MAG: PKD domain-containing protein, partial [Bacteroidales bacterium]|nr:PKD domain-containing protein [Bacteroidales bacterium]